MLLISSMRGTIRKFFSDERTYIRGAAIVAAGGLISKLLGALYRIPLTNIIGGEGMGIYQMVYPLYCILLTVSSSGIPSGMARLIASGRARGAERQAFVLYGLIGLAGAGVMFALSAPLAAVQGEPAVELCCKLLSPAVFFVSVLAVVRGYFQGRREMLPTALTEICEQLLKVTAGVAFALYFKNNMPLATACTACRYCQRGAFFSFCAYYVPRRKRSFPSAVFAAPYGLQTDFKIHCNRNAQRGGNAALAAG